VACVFAACAGHLDPRENGAYGGEPERQLVEATVANDVARVKQLLASGADPNKMAPHEGHQQSSWKLDVNTPRAASTPLAAAITARNGPLIVYLEQHGAKKKT